MTYVLDHRIVAMTFVRIISRSHLAVSLMVSIVTTLLPDRSILPQRGLEQSERISLYYRQGKSLHISALRFVDTPTMSAIPRVGWAHLLPRTQPLPYNASSFLNGEE